MTWTRPTTSLFALGPAMDGAEATNLCPNQMATMARNGDRAAWDQLFGTWVPRMARPIAKKQLGWLRHVEQEDIVHSMVLDVMMGFEQWNPERGPFENWARIVARNYCIRLRNKGRLPTEDLAVVEGGGTHQLPGPPSTADARLDHREFSQRVLKALATMSDDDRQLLLLRVRDDDVPTIAHYLGTTTGWVSVRTTRIVDRLQEAIEQGGSWHLPRGGHPRSQKKPA